MVVTNGWNQGEKLVVKGRSNSREENEKREEKKSKKKAGAREQTRSGGEREEKLSEQAINETIRECVCEEGC